MSTQITENISKENPKETGIQKEPTSNAPHRATPVLVGRNQPSNKPWRIILIILAIALNLTIVYVTYLLFTEKRASPPEDQKIAVQFAKDKAILDLWRKAPVQHDGRIKPLESLATDTVLELTGRTKFEKNDPVALYLSWVMLYESGPGDVSEADRAKIDAIAEKVGTDWDNYPFLLCDFHELRQELYKESGRLSETEPADPAEKAKWEVMMYGKYIEPSVVRESLKQRSGKYLDKIYTTIMVEKKAGKAKPLTQLEEKVRQLVNRIHTFDAIRAGKQAGFVDFLSAGPTWFSIYNLKGFENPSAKEPGSAGSWEQTIARFHQDNPEIFTDKDQPYPNEEVKAVLAAWNNLQESYRTGDADAFKAASEKFLNIRNETSQKFKPEFPEASTVGLELTFNHVKPFRWAWVASLLGSMLFGAFLVVKGRAVKLSKVLYTIGMTTYISALALAVFGFYCRVSISGRPPVSNMYESIIWVAFMTGIFGLLLELVDHERLSAIMVAFFRRLIFRSWWRSSTTTTRPAPSKTGRSGKGIIALAGMLVSTIGFVVADQLPAVFSPTIAPLTAVLRDGYWLVIHVLMIVSSYAALALAWGLGNLNIALIVYAPRKQSLIKTLSHFCYRAIQIGVILLFFGTMLGGMWADKSWGRFWGWDPKEVWALIALLCYIIPLHARYVGWIKDFGLAACSVICFSAVVMAWYGVNFILGTGLHSYGFGAGNDLWIYWAGMINLSLVLHAGIRYLGRRGTVQVD